MKISRISLLAVLAVSGLAAFGTVANAQEASTPSTNAPAAGEHHGQRGKLDELLNLTPDQKPKFDAIMKDQGEQLKALKEDTSLSAEDQKAKAKEIRSAASEKIKALLTPEQFTKYQELSKHKGNKKPKTEAGTNAPAATPPPAP
jgi:Spy/CpxP family protein refolding chaperone